jgi:hypothetical protein
MTTKHQTSIEKYREQGLVQLTTWVEPDVLKNIRMIATAQDKTIREVVTERFSDVHMETKGNRVTLKFSKSLEVEGSK